MRTKIESIEEVKRQVINTSLIVASIIGSLAYLASLSRLLKYGFHRSFVINFIVIAVVITITLLRGRLNILLKTYTIIALIILLGLADAFNYGLLSSARIYLILIPFFAIFFLPVKQTLAVFILTMVCFISIGYLHHSGVLKIPEEYLPGPYMLEMYPWIIIAVHIAAVALIIMLVTRKFIITYAGLISGLESLVKERTENLATTNHELSKANEELTHRREALETALMNLKNTQKQLIQSEKMASLGLLSAGIAHEINNPLNFIYGGILSLENYISDHLQDHGLHLAPMLNSMRNGISRAAEIVKSLNLYSRPDETRAVPCDIQTVVENCLAMLNNQLKYRVEIHRHYAADSHRVLGKEGKLHQALLNILLNASQAIENKGTITLTTRIERQHLILSIEDNGCGIRPENLSKITDPFFTTKDPGKGTGLGLSITQSIIQEHKGKLEFESQVNKGTRVIVTLPLAASDLNAST